MSFTFVDFILLIVVLAVLSVAAWVGYTQWRARKLGLPAPTLSSYNPFSSSPTDSYGAPRAAPGGIVGWVNDKVRSFKARSNRSAGGAYEEPSASSRGARSRGFGPLDPDEAWDARVGNEADTYGPGGYYEEQEIGLHDVHANPYERSGRDPLNDAERGRSRTRESEPYLGAQGVRREDPFSDEAEPSNASLRGVSPRPMGQEVRREGSSERRSIFREGV